MFHFIKCVLISFFLLALSNFAISEQYEDPELKDFGVHIPAGGKPTIWVNQSSIGTVAALAANVGLLVGGLLFKNIDKIKKITDSFNVESEKTIRKPVTLIAANNYDYEDLLGVEKVSDMSSAEAVNKLMNELAKQKFGNNIASRRTDVEEFLDRWRFVFSLPSMRRILPLLIKNPLEKLKSLFPSPGAIKKFISKDIQTLLSPPGIKDVYISPMYNKGPYKYEPPIQDVDLLPNINLYDLPTFDDFAVSPDDLANLAKPGSYKLPPANDVTISNVVYPNKTPSKYEIPTSMSNEASYPEPPSKVNGEEQPMYPILQPPPSKKKAPTKPQFQNSLSKPSRKYPLKGISNSHTMAPNLKPPAPENGSLTQFKPQDDDLKMPPFKFPLKEYTQEIIQSMKPLFKKQNKTRVTQKPIIYIFDNEYTTYQQILKKPTPPSFEIENADSKFNHLFVDQIKNKSSQTYESGQSFLAQTDFFNNTIADFFNMAKNKTNQVTGNELINYANDDENPSLENQSQDLVIKVTVKPLSFLQKVMNLKNKNTKSKEKIGKEPKPFISFGSKKKGTQIPNRLGPYTITTNPPPNYFTTSNNQIKYTYSVFTSPPGLQVTVRPHAYQTRPAINFNGPSASVYEKDVDDHHDKKFDVTDKFQKEFSLLDIDQFSELHSGGFWNFDELTNFQQFKLPTKENPNRKGSVQERSRYRQRPRRKIIPKKLSRKDILKDILLLMKQ